MDREKLMIIDGNSIINRAFYAVRPLITREGVHTNGIYGFLSILFKYLNEYDIQYICVAFDIPKPTFRHIKYSEYKAHRKGMPDELREQMPILKDILVAMNIKILELEGYEADDIIGTVAKKCERESIECMIVTGDKDDLQLASEIVHVYLTTTTKGETQMNIYDDKAVVEKYGVSPEALIEVKALMGDSSDNIPGVTGIGEKGALSLISQYHSIDEIYEKLDNLDIRPLVKKKLEVGREMAFLSRDLGRICTDVPIEFEIISARTQNANKTKLLELFQKLEFKAYIKKLDMLAGETAEATVDRFEFGKLPFKKIPCKSELKVAIGGVSEKFVYKLFYDREEISGISFLSNHSCYYAPITDKLSKRELLSVVVPVFEDHSIKKVSHDIKRDIVILQKSGVLYKNIFFDTMIGAYMLEPGFADYDIGTISEFFMKITLPTYEEIVGRGKNQLSMLEVDDDLILEYSCKVVFLILELMNYLEKEMNERRLTALFRDIEMPLVEVLASMQVFGIKVDGESLVEFSVKLDERITVLEQNIYSFAGSEFNISSPKQLGAVLFENLSLPTVKKIKTGYSTNIDVLEKLKDKHEIINFIIEYRQLTKLKSTYCDGLLTVIDPLTGRIHSSFNQTVTVTGRISSTDPNMQNIPVRSELGRELRKMFVAADGYTLVGADYSQIELRVLADIAKDEVMINGFKSGVDIHTLTASQVFGVELSSVTSAQRSAAKAVNFGIVYGIGDYSLSQDISVSLKEAKRYIQNYLAKYSGVCEYMENIKKTAKQDGYVTTMFGRRRYIPEIHSTNFNVRAFGERVALNTPIQGTAADIIKIAMVKVHNRLKKECKQSNLILQVHDELIIEAHDSEVEKVHGILKQEMETAISMRVDLVADVKCGHSWYETK